MPEVVAVAAASAAAGTTIAATTTIVGVATGYGLAATAAYAVGYLATTAVIGMGVSALAAEQMPKPASTNSSQGLMVNFSEAASNQSFVYGRVRKGGVVNFQETTGESNKYLHRTIVLAGHEIDDVEKIYLGGEEVTLDSDGFVTSDPWDRKIRIKVHLGNQTTADPDLVLETSVDANFKGLGQAYLYVRYEYDPEVYQGGEPVVTALIRGKKVYDPRTNTTAWSDNSALCIRDYLTTEYGFNDPALRVDDGYLQIAANECDEAVDGGKRYTTNGVIDAGTSRKEVLRNMVTSCAGTLYVGGGYWKLRAGAYTPSVLSFGVEDLRGPISSKTRASISENFNKVQGKFNDAAQNYTTVDYPTITDAGFVAEDKGVETHTDLTLPFTTDVKTAQRIAKLALYRGRLQTVLSIEVSLKAMEVEVGDTISLTLPRYGFSAKEFEILGWRFSLKGNAPTIKLDLRETEANAYAGNATFSAIPANTPSLPRITAILNGFAVSSGKE